MSDQKLKFEIFDTKARIEVFKIAKDLEQLAEQKAILQILQEEYDRRRKK